MALTDNLVSYYKLDESSGNAADAHGSNTLTNNNTATFTTGKINNAASLAAASSQSFSGTVAIGTTATASLSFWINRSSASNRMDIGWGGIDNDRIYAQVYTDGNIYCPVENGTGSYWNATDGLTGWHHYVIVYDGTLAAGSRVKLYRDGSGVTLTQGGQDPPTTYDGGDSFYIGAYGTSYSNGLFDEVGCWSRALTSEEVTSLYGAGSGLAYPFSAPAATRTSNLTLLGVG